MKQTIVREWLVLYINHNLVPKSMLCIMNFLLPKCYDKDENLFIPLTLVLTPL